MHRLSFTWIELLKTSRYQKNTEISTSKCGDEFSKTRIKSWSGFFKAGLRYSRVSVKSDFRSDSFKTRFSRILFN